MSPARRSLPPRRTLVVVALVLVFACRAANAADGSPHVRYLAQLCRLWGAVKYLHPYLWTRSVDWDAALLEALPKARSATTDTELRAIAGQMLARLHDPATRIVPSPLEPTRAADAPRASEEVTAGVLLVRLDSPDRLSSEALAGIGAAIEKARAVIFDLRTDSPEVAELQASVGDALVRPLLGHVVRALARRFVVHDGYRLEAASDSAYSTWLRVVSDDPITPAGTADKRAVFIFSARSSIPGTGLAMQVEGSAAFVAVGDATLDDRLTAKTPLLIGDGAQAQIRVAEWLPPDGAPPPHADATLPASADQALLVKTALALLARRHPPGRSTIRPAPLTWRAEKAYAGDPAPDVEHRLLALFRLWNVIDRFYPYKDLLDERWDSVLESFIPRFEASLDRNGYAEMIAALSTHIEDSHVMVVRSSDPLVTTLAPPPFLARMIEGQPVVVRMLDAAAAGELRIGDVIVTIDGEPVAARLATVRKLVAGSNEASRALATLRRALSGRDGTPLELTVVGKDKVVRRIVVKRQRAFIPATFEGWRSGDVVRVADGNIGYVDIDRLDEGDVDAAFAKLAQTRAIVFDMRGYPRGGSFERIASRLNVRQARTAAVFERRTVDGAWELERGTELEQREEFLQAIRPTGKPLYRGRTFLLVDERTFSGSEHAGLLFEAAAGTTIVGSQTAGADGDMSHVVLPGGLIVTFTGQAVRHPDGRVLQRVGLPIAIHVTPTIAGIRAGRDEVLERALAEARAGH